MTAVCIPPCTQIKFIRRQWRWYSGKSVSQNIFLKWSSCNYCTLYHQSYSIDLQQSIHDGVPENFVIPVLWNQFACTTANCSRFGNTHHKKLTQYGAVASCNIYMNTFTWTIPTAQQCQTYRTPLWQECQSICL